MNDAESGKLRTTVTDDISQAVAPIRDPVWQFEIGKWLADSRPPAAAPLGSWRAGALLALGALGAFVALFYTLLRFGGSRPAALRMAVARNGETLFCLHGEDTNRTRHLRRLIARSACQRPVLLVLGRPAHLLSRLRAAIDPDNALDDPTCLRPLSLRAVWGAIPSGIAAIVKERDALGALPFSLTFSDLLRFSFRIAAGAATQRWWDAAFPGGKASPPPAIAIFAHTGTAEASMLEQAMQRAGTATVHLAHGSNNGWPFAAASDLAIFHSRADAELARSLPAYGRTLAVPTAPPRPAVTDGRWALLTSYSHLQQETYRRDGSLADRTIAGWLAHAARTLGKAPSDILWRPHPHIAVIAADERRRLEQAVAEAGFQPWPDDLPYDALGTMDVVVTTPSTVMIDALRRGQPAIVANTASLDTRGPYVGYPLLAESREALLTCVRAMLDPASRAENFLLAWETVGPGEIDGLRLSQITNLATGHSEDGAQSVRSR